MTEISLHGTIFIDGDIGADHRAHADWPVVIKMGTVNLLLTEAQAVQLESQLVHVLAGIRTDALVQS